MAAKTQLGLIRRVSTPARRLNRREYLDTVRDFLIAEALLQIEGDRLTNEVTRS